PEEALAHLADHAVNAAAGRAKITAPWSDVLRWIERSPEYRPRIDAVRAGLAFPSKLGREKISPEFIERLTDFAVSPSQIERYSRCRFSWLMGSALKLGERRIHELDPRSFGDIYHELLMGYGERVNKNSAWETVTREECADMIRELYDRIAPRYREGLLKSPGGLTEYKAERITNVAAGVAWAVTNQVRGSDIAEMFFEAAFGRNAPFAPIEIETGTAGENITIGGRIDRVDIRRGEDGENAVITDYKSGSDEFSPDDVRGGWQLQLLLYLLAVSGKYRPGGVHYFGISEPHIEDKGRGDEYLEKELARSFKPKGSDAETNLEELMDSVRVRLRDLAAALHTGSASARPMTAKKLKPGTNLPLRACTYCNFKGICGYDPTISR
ncbi:MAG: PD-(D/E)XK nuclease family protein, partial [Clostridiales Family XIII bacterium]|nr:PD-(D/E)XK nuclease family protein [Clostridiales Family XIII bacterium]